MKALPLRDARARLAAPDAPEAFSPIAGEPLLAVLLDGDAADDPAAARALAALPAPSIALVPDAKAPAARRWGKRFDVVVESEAQLAALAAAIRRAPLAAGTLAQLLRGAESRGIEEGLIVESFAYSMLLGGPGFRAWLAAREPRRRDARPATFPLVVHRTDAELCITLARPEKRNAYDVAMRDALVEVLAFAARDDSIERVVLDAEGPAFCAGGDLDEFGLASDPVTAHAVRTTRSAARLIAALADRVEVHVQGACIGAGIELAAFAGRVVASGDAWFALPELAMGLLPGAGGTVSLPRRIGRQRTAWLALSGARLDAREARAWGLIDAVV